jgi:hypothetical protein
MTTMCRGLMAVVLWTVFVGGIAAAEDLTVRKYRSFPDRGLLAVYLHGVRKGLLMMNAELAARGQPPVFCMPSDLELGATDVIKMLDHRISLLPGPPMLPSRSSCWTASSSSSPANSPHTLAAPWSDEGWGRARRVAVSPSEGHRKIVVFGSLYDMQT